METPLYEPEDDRELIEQMRASKDAIVVITNFLPGQIEALSTRMKATSQRLKELSDGNQG